MIGPARIIGPERAALVAHAERIIAQGSQSFAMASRLFDPAARERAWLLYAWCRICDDMVDGQTLGRDMAAPRDAALDAPGQLAALRQLTDAALAGAPDVAPEFAGLRCVVAEARIPPAYLHDHLAGFAADASGWRPRGEADLLLYCYQVAGVVGCMMAIIMGVDPADRDTLDRACDLGIAFQLANIARDIREDATNGRCYIPADWLANAGLTEADVAGDQAAPRLAGIAARLVAIAERHEASARIGAHRLRFRCRWAVLAAAGIYGGIGREVVRQGAHAWDRRVTISGRDKLRLAFTALLRSALPLLRAPARRGLWDRTQLCYAKA